MKNLEKHYPSVTEKELVYISGGSGLAVAGVIFAAGSLALGIIMQGINLARI